MLNQSSLSAHPGSTKTRKRVGRGNGSGKGSFSGHGVKGQGSRSGNGKFNPAFEGGQTPLFRRLPKARGFNAYNPTTFSVINVDTLEILAASGVTEIDTLVLVGKSLVKKGSLVKVLGNGNITKSITIRVNKISAEAQKKIEAAGGKIELI